MEFDITKIVEEIAMQATENQEEFIFKTIRPYCENILQMKINKEELKQILLNGIRKQQPNEDCISRKSVVEWLERCTDDSIEHAIDSNLDFIPSVVPQRPKGKWIDRSCSICGYGIAPWNKTPYCPNCGSRMEVGE